jgi:hypothetical protein
MKITKSTLDILNNFAAINQNLYLKAGNKSSSFAVAGDILAVAEFEDTFPVNFPIYNLREFLGAVNLFDSPEITFDENGKEAIISSGKYAVKYYAAELEHITYRDKEPNQLDVYTTINLSANNLQAILKSAQTLKAPDISFVSDGNTVQVVVTDRTRSNSNRFKIDIAEGDGKKFEFHQKVQRLEILPGDYKLEISKKNVGVWTKLTGNVKYYISFDKESKSE